jgi:hypothetical protein
LTVLIEVNEFIKAVEKRVALKVMFSEEIAYN